MSNENKTSYVLVLENTAVVTDFLFKYNYKN